MKLVIVFCFVAAVAATTPKQFATNQNDNVQLLRYNKDTNTNGGYSFNYDQSDGQRRQEQGGFKNAGLDNQVYSVKGYYQWISPTGVQYTITYVADEDGYKPDVQEGPGDIPPLVIQSMVG